MLHFPTGLRSLGGWALGLALLAAPRAEAQVPLRPWAGLLQPWRTGLFQAVHARPASRWMALQAWQPPGAFRPMATASLAGRFAPVRCLAPVFRPSLALPAVRPFPSGRPRAASTGTPRLVVKATAPRLRSCGQCDLSAELRLGSQSPWQWMVEEPEGGTLSREPSGRIRYIAPFVSRKRTFHVRASSILDPRNCGEVAIDVYPNALLVVLDPAKAPGEAVPPVLVMVAGSPTGKSAEPDGESDGWQEAARFARPHGIAYMAHSRQWLVTYPGNRVFVMEPGPGGPMAWFGARLQEAEPEDDVQPGAQLACPTRLAANGGHGPDWRCVFSETDQDRIRMVDGRGVISPVAGEAALGDDTPQARHLDGRQDAARFRAPEGLAMDRHGTIYVADVGNGALRRIRDGAVTTLRSPGGNRFRHAWGGDDREPRFPFAAPLNGGLALDEAGGVLYVGVGHSVLGVSLGEGTAATVLGDPVEPGFEAWRSDPPGSLAGVPCLFWPQNLAFFGGRLYLSDHGNHAVRVYEPDTGRLKTLAGHPSQPVTRAGPLVCGSPHLGPEHCAALAYPLGIAFSADGECRVATRDGVVALLGLTADGCSPARGRSDQAG